MAFINSAMNTIEKKLVTNKVDSTINSIGWNEGY